VASRPRPEIKAQNRCFGGTQGVYRHHSEATGTEMSFAVYLPPGAEKGKTPALFYLSGLTCTWENATTKAGAQRYAAEQGIALVFPDTSPRGEGVADSDDWQLGQGAGFYVDATEKPWAPHFSMQRYIVDELYEATIKHFGFDRDRIGIMGHSMGGHGALTLAMRHPAKYRSLSALSAIVAPSRVEWGQKALRAYLGDDRAVWQQHDACALMALAGVAR
jgi:S-formylglutathione hydrolase